MGLSLTLFCIEILYQKPSGIPLFLVCLAVLLQLCPTLCNPMDYI